MAKAVEVVVVGKRHTRVEENRDGTYKRVHYDVGDVLRVSEREQQTLSHRLHLTNPPRPTAKVKDNGDGDGDGDGDDDDNGDGDDLPDGVTVEGAGGTWFLVRTPDDPDGIKVNGKGNLSVLLAELRANG